MPGFLHGASRLGLTADQVAAAVGVMPITGSGRVSVFGHGRGGTAIGFTPGPIQVTDIRPAVLADRGPQKGDEDFDTAVYWTQAFRPGGGSRSDSITLQPNVEDYDKDWWVPATNLAEHAAGTHSLPTDGTELVIVFRIVDTAGNERFVFSRPPVPVTFPARLGTATRDGSKWRWTYDYTEVESTGAGYDSWTTKAGGRTGTAYNTVEDMNGTSGLVGTGIDVDNLPVGFSLMPAPENVVVRVELVPRADDPTADPTAWFQFENSADGTCA